MENFDYYNTNTGGIECIDAMEAAYGTEAVYWFCRCVAFKYNWRAGLKKSTKDLKVDHPDYYNSGSIECIDAMEAAYGTEAVYWFCRCNSFKYNWRAGERLNMASLELDLGKAIWYQEKAVELSKKLGNNDEILGSEMKKAAWYQEKAIELSRKLDSMYCIGF